jgi:hypothetical protein
MQPKRRRRVRRASGWNAAKYVEYHRWVLHGRPPQGRFSACDTCGDFGEYRLLFPSLGFEFLCDPCMQQAPIAHLQQAEGGWLIEFNLQRLRRSVREDRQPPNILVGLHA